MGAMKVFANGPRRWLPMWLLAAAVSPAGGCGLLALPLLAVADVENDLPWNYGTAEVLVLDGDTGRPIAGAVAESNDGANWFGGPTVRAATGPDGRAILERHHEDNQITAEAAEYLEPARENVVRDGRVWRVALYREPEPGPGLLLPAGFRGAVDVVSEGDVVYTPESGRPQPRIVWVEVPPAGVGEVPSVRVRPVPRLTRGTGVNIESMVAAATIGDEPVPVVRSGAVDGLAVWRIGSVPDISSAGRRIRRIPSRSITRYAVGDLDLARQLAGAVWAQRGTRPTNAALRGVDADRTIVLPARRLGG